MLQTTKPFIAYYFNLNKDIAIKKVAARCQSFIGRQHLLQFQPHKKQIADPVLYCPFQPLLPNGLKYCGLKGLVIMEYDIQTIYFHLLVFVCHTLLLFGLGPLVWLDNSTGEVKIMGVVSYGPGKLMSLRKFNHQKCSNIIHQ